MKNSLLLILCLLSFSMAAQQIDYNDQDGFVADGYDVTTYFDGKPLKGLTKYTFKHEGVWYKFASAAKRDLFKADPQKYIPLYGGWCAYAMGTTGDKVQINPKTYEIRNGRLLLFYNAYLTNTLKKWQKEGPEQLQPKADANWERVKSGKR